jgi:hypothetical protein
MSNAELLSLMADEIATLRRLAETASPILGRNLSDALSHLDRVYDALLDDPEVMRTVGFSLADRLPRR